MSRDPIPAFNEAIHSPGRLRSCGLLRRVSELEFAVIRDEVPWKLTWRRLSA